MAILQEALDAARAGRGSIVGIEGEAGLGKSRLKWETRKLAEPASFEVNEGRAISFGGMSYWAIGELLRDALQLPLISPREETLAEVASEAARLRLDATDRHHLAEVLGARFDKSPLHTWTETPSGSTTSSPSG